MDSYVLLKDPHHQLHGALQPPGEIVTLRFDASISFAYFRIVLQKVFVLEDVSSRYLVR